MQNKKGGDIVVNTLKIKARMVELGLTQKDIATALELATPTVNQKLNNKRPMNLNEANLIANILNIDSFQYCEYFFYNQNCIMQ